MDFGQVRRSGEELHGSWTDSVSFSFSIVYARVRGEFCVLITFTCLLNINKSETEWTK